VAVLDVLRSESALDCEPGVARLFGLADIATQGLLTGWAGPEEGHNWNDGLEAEMTLSLRHPGRRMQLCLIGEPYVTRAHPRQDMTVHGNGFRVGFVRLTSRAEVALRFALEPEWWFLRGGRAVLRLAFALPHSIAPKDLSDGPDGRTLGFCFRSLCLRDLPG
jgi:hypothetical protein